MWINRERQTVAQWELRRGGSHCPLCDRSLVARRGDLVRWHWAHRSLAETGERCPWEESAWHLQWKLLFMDELGWEIELPWSAGGKRFVLDAVRPDGDLVLEFVHSMSPYYGAKHAALRESGLNVNWLLDGDEWVSARRVATNDGRGYRRFLKARAFDDFQAIQTCWVHWGSCLWKHWRANVWYPWETPRSHRLLGWYWLRTE